MQFALLFVLGSSLGLGMRRIIFWRRMGFPRTARRLYRLFAWSLGLGTWLSMLVQETVLLLSGLLTWQTGLPLHLCSLMGLISLPMLLSGNRLLWHASLYLGLPGALAALLFPAILETDYPQLTVVSFHAMHVCLLLAPFLPLSLGRMPSPRGAGSAWGLLLLLGCVALTVNALLESNYLFLSWAPPGTPLALLTGGGRTAYVLTLTALSALLLALEAAAMHFLLRHQRT